MKCQVCKDNEVSRAWQPFGPGETPTATLLGSHYRGFPVIKVCADCLNTLQDGCPMEFSYKDKRYIGNNTEVVEIPQYVSDPLLYWEEH